MAQESYNSISQGCLRQELEDHLQMEMEKLLTKVPFARQFHEGTSTDQEYYARHLVEAVLRIILNNEVDAFCLYNIAKQNHPAAKILTKYLAEEYGHDELLLSDLELFGLSREEVLKMQPFFSTQLLIGYLYFSIARDGALPTMLWNWLVEWYSDRFNKIITNKARQEFGSDRVRGTQAHLQLDKDLDHADQIFTSVGVLIDENGKMVKAKEYLTNFTELISMYFQELYDATLAKRYSGVQTDVTL